MATSEAVAERLRSIRAIPCGTKLVCPRCGIDFVKTRACQAFCTAACGNAARQEKGQAERDKARANKPMVPWKCEVCGTEGHRRDYKVQKYCGGKCRTKAGIIHRTDRRAVGRLTHCDVEGCNRPLPIGRQRFCSPECSKKQDNINKGNRGRKKTKVGGKTIIHPRRMSIVQVQNCPPDKLFRRLQQRGYRSVKGGIINTEVTVCR